MLFSPRFTGALAFFAILSLGALLWGLAPVGSLGPPHAGSSLTDPRVPREIFRSADVSVPVHDWTFRIQGATYGLSQWGSSDCALYVRRKLCTVGMPAPFVAVLLLLSFSAAIWGLLQVISNRTGAGDQGRESFPK